MQLVYRSMPGLVPTLVELARPLPPLTYLAPAGLPRGLRVRVRIRSGAAVGFVLGPDPSPPPKALKAVEAVLDPFPLLPPQVLELMEFGSAYYGCGLAHLASLALPGPVLADWGVGAPGIGTLALAREAGRWDELADLGLDWHRGRVQWPALFHRRALRGAGRMEVRRTERPHPARVSALQARVLLALEGAGGALLEEDLLERAGVGRGVLGTLEKHGLLLRMKRVDLLSQRREEGMDLRVELNPEQRRVMEGVELGTFGVHLVYGVTGSGKTEIYLELAEKVLAAGRRVLWLVPEIGLTPRLLARLEARFPGKVAVGHAGLNATERQADVVRLLQNGAPIFVGVRNAVLAPLRDLGLLVVDEEHEASYKSEEHPRFNARDLAIKRGQIEGCPVVLGSATPSLESWHAAHQGRYALHTLRQRPAGATLPAVKVVDLREVYRESRRRPVFSPLLLKALGETLERGEQAMLLLNRRGFENFWMCRACGKSLECSHCAVSLTFHRGEHRLKCHLCGFEAVPPEVCPGCGADHLKGVGEGTEQIESLLRARFPSARILRLDRDTTSRKGNLEAALLAAERGEADLLVGTQMLAKGHHFPGLTLVGILNADLGLKVPDFRAAERTFQLLTQVAGRAGRAQRPGRVILQTYSPEHPAIVHAVAQDFEAFAAAELPYRSGMHYPPYSHLVLFRAESEDSMEARSALESLAGRLPSGPGLRILGPLEGPVPRVRDRFQWVLLARAGTRSLQGVLMRQSMLRPGGLVQADRDPLNWGV
ncbi:MAG: primosomal protein N' [Acidobacteria bacterium]|nr:primosomal protein N' [Acidobacteriota bacterium]